MVGASFKAHGGASSSENQAHRPRGDGESCPGGGRSLLPGPWGRVFFGEPGTPAWGGRGGQPRGWSEPPSTPMGRRHFRRTGPTGLGGTGSPAHGVVGASYKAHVEASSSENRAHRPGGDGESCPGGGRSLLQGPWGGVIFGEPGTPAWGGRGVQPRGWSEPPSRPMGRRYFRRTGHTGLGGTGGPAQGVVGASFKAHGGASSSENRAHRPRGDGESCPGGGRSLLPGPWGRVFFGEPGTPAWGGRGGQPRGWSEPPSRPMGGRHFRRTGPTGLGGTGSPAHGVVGASYKAHVEASSSENRAHRPGGDGESCPGGGRSLLQGPWGGVIFGEPGPPAWGGRGVQPRGWSEPPCRPRGGVFFGEPGTPAWGDGESSAGGGRSLLQGPWGGVTGLPCCAGSPALEPPGLSPCTVPLLARGPLTSVMSSLRGPLYPHTWTPAMKTPHRSLLGFAPGLLRSRGRPPMRGPGGAPHGRCQPARGVWAACEGGGGKGRQGGVMGQRRWLGAIRGGSAWGGHRGARRGGGRGGQRQERGGGACLGSFEGPVCGRARRGERRGRLGQPSSLGVADRSLGRSGRY